MKKRRAFKACFHCNRLHRKCDNVRPCTNCIKYKKECFEYDNKGKKKDSAEKKIKVQWVDEEGNPEYEEEYKEDPPQQINSKLEKPIYPVLDNNNPKILNNQEKNIAPVIPISPMKTSPAIYNPPPHNFPLPSHSKMFVPRNTKTSIGFLMNMEANHQQNEAEYIYPQHTNQPHHLTNINYPTNNNGLAPRSNNIDERFKEGELLTNFLSLVHQFNENEVSPQQPLNNNIINTNPKNGVNMNNNGANLGISTLNNNNIINTNTNNNNNTINTNNISNINNNTINTTNNLIINNNNNNNNNIANTTPNVNNNTNINTSLDKYTNGSLHVVPLAPQLPTNEGILQELERLKKENESLKKRLEDKESTDLTTNEQKKEESHIQMFLPSQGKLAGNLFYFVNWEKVQHDHEYNPQHEIILKISENLAQFFHTTPSKVNGNKVADFIPKFSESKMQERALKLVNICNKEVNYIKVMAFIKANEDIYVVETKRAVFCGDNGKPFFSFSLITSLSKASSDILKDPNICYDFQLLD